MLNDSKDFNDDSCASTEEDSEHSNNKKNRLNNLNINGPVDSERADINENGPLKKMVKDSRDLINDSSVSSEKSSEHFNKKTHLNNFYINGSNENSKRERSVSINSESTNINESELLKKKVGDLKDPNDDSSASSEDGPEQSNKKLLSNLSISGSNENIGIKGERSLSIDSEVTEINVYESLTEIHNGSRDLNDDLFASTEESSEHCNKMRNLRNRNINNSDQNNAVKRERCPSDSDMYDDSSDSSNDSFQHSIFDVKEEKYSSDEEDGKIMMNDLKNLRILIDFEVPPLHKIADWSTAVNKQQRKEIAKRGLVVKSGKFTKNEDDQIKKNWAKFVKIYNIKDNPELFFSLDQKIISREEKRNFLCFMSQNLPERIPCSIFTRFRRMIVLAGTKKGRYTAEEDKYILNMMKETKCQRNYMTEIAKHLGRPMDSVENRISILKNRHTRKIRWKKNNFANYVKYLIKVTDVNDVSELKNRHITNSEFAKLSKKLDNLPVRILKCAWHGYIHHRLFIPESICDLRDIKHQLIKILVKNGENDWKTINWSSYVKYFDGFASLKLYHLLKSLAKYIVPQKERGDLGACLKIMSNLSPKKIKKKLIYKVKYANNTIHQIEPKL